MQGVGWCLKKVYLAISQNTIVKSNKLSKTQIKI